MSHGVGQSCNVIAVDPASGSVVSVFSALQGNHVKDTAARIRAGIVFQYITVSLIEAYGHMKDNMSQSLKAKCWMIQLDVWAGSGELLCAE